MMGHGSGSTRSLRRSIQTQPKARSKEIKDPARAGTGHHPRLSLPQAGGR